MLKIAKSLEKLVILDVEVDPCDYLAVVGYFGVGVGGEFTLPVGVEIEDVRVESLPDFHSHGHKMMPERLTQQSLPRISYATNISTIIDDISFRLNASSIFL